MLLFGECYEHVYIYRRTTPWTRDSSYAFMLMYNSVDEQDSFSWEN
jgi:hypothetical protein